MSDEADKKLADALASDPRTMKDMFDQIAARKEHRKALKGEAKQAALAIRDEIVSKPVLPYDAKVALHVCDLIAQGFTLHRISEEPGMPAPRTILAWLHKHNDFAEMYDRAKEIRAEAMGAEILAIADDTSKDVIERVTPKGTVVLSIDHECVNRSRLRVDTRRWLMSKDKPRTYGDNIAVGGGSGIKATLVIEG